VNALAVSADNISTGANVVGVLAVAAMILVGLGRSTIGKAVVGAIARSIDTRSKAKLAAATKAAAAATKAAKAAKAGAGRTTRVGKLAAAPTPPVPTLGGLERTVIAGRKTVLGLVAGGRATGRGLAAAGHGLATGTRSAADWTSRRITAARAATKPAGPSAGAPPSPGGPAPPAATPATPTPPTPAAAPTTGGTAVYDQIKDCADRFAGLAEIDLTTLTDDEMIAALAALSRFGHVQSETTTTLAERLMVEWNLDPRVHLLIADGGGGAASYAEALLAANKEYVRLYELDRAAAGSGVRQMRRADDPNSAARYMRRAG
jgi:hypothetical protein